VWVVWVEFFNAHYDVAKLFLLTALGCMLLYVYADVKEFSRSRDFVQGIFPMRGQAFHNRVDFLMSVVLGSVVATVIFVPAHAVEAIAAGLGWIGGVNAAIARKKP
jgi:predicted small integral membrane protein